MDKYEYFKKNFKLFTREEYKECNLSNSTKRILCDIGLPNEPLNFIQFNIREIESIILDEEHVIIGNDFGTYICINRKQQIVSIDPQNEYPIRFVNKNLETLLQFIAIILSYEDKMNEANDDETYQIMQEIRKKFDIIDIQALSNEEHWWSIILEQFELGIL